MPRRRTRSGKIIEWVFNNMVMSTSGTAVSATLDLDLLPDEIAEIVKIDSTLAFEDNPEKVDSVNFIAMALSMDPNYDDDPTPILASPSNTDLEVFYEHFWSVAAGVTSSGGHNQTYSHTKISDFFLDPILVGTNIGARAIFSATTATIDATAIVRVYFRRRRATASELNQILLKRR